MGGQYVLNKQAAILDRLLFKCEVVKLSGKSYRLENRKTIFENEVL
jgi:DNA replication protein DnaC